MSEKIKETIKLINKSNNSLEKNLRQVQSASQELLQINLELKNCAEDLSKELKICQQEIRQLSESIKNHISNFEKIS